MQVSASDEGTRPSDSSEPMQMMALLHCKGIETTVPMRNKGSLRDGFQATTKRDLEAVQTCCDYMDTMPCDNG